MEARRQARIADKEAAALDRRGVQMPYLRTVPAHFHKNTIVPSRPAPKSEDELARMKHLDAKRNSAIEFKQDCKRVFSKADVDQSGALE